MNAQRELDEVMHGRRIGVVTVDEYVRRFALLSFIAANHLTDEIEDDGSGRPPYEGLSRAGEV